MGVVMRVAIVTGVYGNYDPVRNLPHNHGFDDAVCVTDDPSIVANGWRVVHRPSSLPSRMACKLPKMMPWNFTDCDAAVWIDASFSINSSLSDFVRPQLEENDFIVFNHPENRDCIVQEMEHCYSWLKYKDYPMREQVQSYMSEGMPEHYGLWAAGMVGWRFTEQAKQFGKLWYAENASWSIQDQISLPYLLWKHKRIPGIWQCHEFNNPHVVYHYHSRHD